MKGKTVLHILRNPYGHSKDEIKTARLSACDRIEELETALRKIENINCGHDGDCGAQKIIDSVL